MLDIADDTPPNSAKKGSPITSDHQSVLLNMALGPVLTSCQWCVGQQGHSFAQLRMKHHTSYKSAVRCSLDDSPLYVKVHHGVPTPRSHGIDIFPRISGHSLSMRTCVVLLTQIMLSFNSDVLSKDGRPRTRGEQRPGHSPMF